MEAAAEPVPAVYRDVIAVGASAGGVEALTELVGGLSSEFPVSLLVVLHVLPTGTSVLAKILERAGDLPAGNAQDGQAIERGRIYVAPPDRHLVVKAGALALSRGPRENGHRPAIDPLFRSVARELGARAIGVVLSGSQDDGAAGLRLLKLHGGAAVAQDPDDALYPSMPTHACHATEIDRVAPASGMAQALTELVEIPVEEPDIDLAARLSRRSRTSSSSRESRASR